MKVSIITPTFNSAETLENTIKSVLSQSYPDIEYIIVDGKSTDNTLDIVKKYDKINKVISEPDKGIYDAMNKGIRLATGDVVGILNSDDIYASENVIDRVVKAIKETDCCWGNLLYVDKKDENKTIRRWISSEYKEDLFEKGWHPPHSTFFVKKNVYDRYGVFNLNFKIAADYELMLRLLEKNKISFSFIPEILVKMKIGGTSNRSVLNIIKANIECYNAWKVNELKINPLKLFLKPFSKVKQYF